MELMMYESFMAHGPFSFSDLNSQPMNLRAGYTSDREVDPLASVTPSGHAVQESGANLGPQPALHVSSSTGSRSAYQKICPPLHLPAEENLYQSLSSPMSSPSGEDRYQNFPSPTDRNIVPSRTEGSNLSLSSQPEEHMYEQISEQPVLDSHQTPDGTPALPYMRPSSDVTKCERYTCAMVDIGFDDRASLSAIIHILVLFLLC